MNVPIGLISSSYGGTVIEAWTSWDIMGKDEQFKTIDLDAKEKENAGMQEKINNYREAMKNDKGELEKWYAGDDTSGGWKAMELPQLWEKTEVGNADGIVWFKKEFDLLPVMEGKPATIHLGPVDDDDVTYLNGKKIGTTVGYNIDRVYRVDPFLLQQGKNTIVVKVIDNGGGGGLYGTPEQLFIDGNGSKISLAGAWQYKPSALTTQYGVVDAGPNSFPSQLYNAMIAPLVPLSIKGGNLVPRRVKYIGSI
ncbi:MAG: sugar-binding domain-containing protein [Bacteroidota bacterium]